MSIVKPLYQDPFAPVLLSSPALVVTDEQKLYIREVLELSASDSKFAQKAYDAITRILTGGSVKVPTVTSLVPNSAQIGDPSFTLHVHGTNFNAGTKIIFAGQEEPTTLVSPTEVTTGVNMAVWLGADVLPVEVQDSNGVISNSMPFTFVSVASFASPVIPPHAHATPTSHHAEPHHAEPEKHETKEKK